MWVVRAARVCGFVGDVGPTLTRVAWVARVHKILAQKVGVGQENCVILNLLLFNNIL